jgi:2-polyprenyl-3-methyl-5-hydroxy-6-metoxy-1,4-benzoquinol methylase
MNWTWFNNLVRDGASAVLDHNIWLLHPQDSDQFFADYLSAKFWKELETAESLGWQKAVENGLQLLNPYDAAYTCDYFFSSYRSDFVEDLGITPGATILDVGCGWGFASQRCLEKGAAVVGTDLALKRLEFCATRFQQQGFGDRWVGVEMDANRLFPFRADTFDVLIVSGVMEWLPCSAAGAPRKLQERFMEQCFRIIKPRGRLYLAIENRYWGKYFLGARDLHTSQRFASILPRNLARSYSILTGCEDYRAWTYSLLEYLKWLKAIGYSDLTVIYPEPDYVQPRTTIALVKGFPLDPPSGDLWRAFNRKTANRWAGMFGRSFMFIATK